MQVPTVTGAVHALAAASGNKADMAGAWNDLWSSLTSSIPNLSKLLTIFAILIAIGAIAKHTWDRRRGGANTSHLGWSLFVAGLLAAPGLLFPLLLKIADGLINFIGNLLGS